VKLTKTTLRFESFKYKKKNVKICKGGAIKRRGKRKKGREGGRKFLTHFLAISVT